MAEHDDPAASGGAVTGLEQPSIQRPRAEYVEQVGRGPCRNDLNGVADTRERHPPARRRGSDVDEGPGAGAQEIHVANREKSRRRDCHQSVGIRVRQRPKQNPVQDREHCRVGAGAKRDDGSGKDGERGITPEGADREPKVLQHETPPAGLDGRRHPLGLGGPSLHWSHSDRWLTGFLSAPTVACREHSHAGKRKTASWASAVSFW